MTPTLRSWRRHCGERMNRLLRRHVYLVYS